MQKSSRVRDSQEEANVTQLQYVSKLLCPMSRHWRTLDYVLLCFLILSAASSCWCIVKIAAGGKSSGSGKSRGGFSQDSVLAHFLRWTACSWEILGTLLPWDWGSVAQLSSWKWDVCEVRGLPRGRCHCGTALSQRQGWQESSQGEEGGSSWAGRGCTGLPTDIC